jgi:hypothetical protein
MFLHFLSLQDEEEEIKLEINVLKKVRFIAFSLGDTIYFIGSKLLKRPCLPTPELVTVIHITDLKR